MTQSDSRIDYALHLLAGPPVSPEAAAGTLSRARGAYAWWAYASVLPDLPGLVNDHDPNLRFVYVGQAVNLRGRVLKTHLRRTEKSELRRILAGLLMSTEGYHTMWDDGVTLIPEDDRRLTSWMHRSLRLTWAEYPYPDEIVDDLIDRFTPPLNIHGAPDSDTRAAVLAARDRFESSARPPA